MPRFLLCCPSITALNVLLETKSCLGFDEKRDYRGVCSTNRLLDLNDLLFASLKNERDAE